MRSSTGRHASTGWTSPGKDTFEREPAPLGPGVFMPDIVEAMSDAFDRAWTAMRAAGVACAMGHLAAETRRQLALAIVESARRGTRSRMGLSEDALRSFLPLGLEGQVGGWQGEDEARVFVMDRQAPHGLGIRAREPSTRARTRQPWEFAGRSRRPQDDGLSAEFDPRSGLAVPEASAIGGTSPRNRE